jgi:UDPglucose 6-dehydrogenase
MSKIMRNKVIFDGRNQYNPKAVKDMGFTYYGIGRH